MDKRYSIVIDTLGSDKGPEAILEGAKLVLNSYDNIDLVIVGDENIIKNYDLDFSRVKIINSCQTVSNLDSVTEAFYKKADVSVFKAMEVLAKEDHIGLISAGNSGALLVSTILYRLCETASRPCMAAVLPNITGGYTVLVDTGASIDCGPAQLHEFGRLGSNFMKYLYKIDNPRVGLLSNGAEPTKGNKAVKEAHKLLAADSSLNFVGNIEGNKALSGLCDVLVADGFAGNQVLKNSEGMAVNLITEIVTYAKKNKQEEVIMPLVQHLMKTYDFESLGAGIILGVKKHVMKCRGSSGASAIKSAAHMLINIAENKSFYSGIDDHRK